MCLLNNTTQYNRRVAYVFGSKGKVHMYGGYHGNVNVVSD